MDKVPTLQEWKAANPGKGLNEYYAQYGHLAQGAPQQPPLLPPVAPQQVVYVERNGGVDVIGVLANGVALAAFFAPWLRFGFLAGFKKIGDVSPQNFISALTQIGAIQTTEDASLQFTLLTPWLLLLLPIVGLLCALVGHVVVRVIGAYIYVAICCYWLFSAFVIAQGVTSSTGQVFTGTVQAGFYLGIVSAVLMLADAIQAPWRQR